MEMGYRFPLLKRKGSENSPTHSASNCVAFGAGPACWRRLASLPVTRVLYNPRSRHPPTKPTVPLHVPFGRERHRRTCRCMGERIALRRRIDWGPGLKRKLQVGEIQSGGGINSSPRPLAIYSTHTRRDCDEFLRPETIGGIKAELTELLSDMSKMVSSFQAGNPASGTRAVGRH